MGKSIVDSKTVFISWAGDGNQKFASFIAKWIPKHLPGARTWATFKFSDLPQGKSDFDGITKAALSAGACVAIVTPDSTDRPWMGFELGIFFARRKNLFALLCNLELVELRGQGHPLGFMNVTFPTLVSIRGLLRNLNDALKLQLPSSKIDEIAGPAFKEYIETFSEYYPELSEAERETGGFTDNLID